MLLSIDIDTSDLIQSIIENYPNENIKDFILDLDASLGNEDFTIDLILNLLESIGLNKEQIEEIKDHLKILGYNL